MAMIRGILFLVVQGISVAQVTINGKELTTVQSTEQTSHDDPYLTSSNVGDQSPKQHLSTSRSISDNTGSDFWSNSTEFPLETDSTTQGLSGIPLMKYLFQIRFHADVYQNECVKKLADHGYKDRLHLFSLYCLCTYNFCQFVGHQLSEFDIQRRDEYKELVRRQSEETKFKTILPITAGLTGTYAFITLVGVFGNALVLVTVSKFMHKPSVTYIFICCIACGDLLVCGVCAPMKMYRRLNSADSHPIMCRVMHFLYFLSLGCSVFSLLAMSLERYLVICHPMKAQAISTPSRAKKIVLAVWFASAVGAIPYVYFTTAGSACFVDFSHLSALGQRALTLTLMAVFYIMPVLLMTYAYISVSVALWKSIKTSKSLQNQGAKAKGNDNKKAEKEKNEASGRVAVIRMLILVLVVFILCWSPYWLFWILRFTSAVPRTMYHQVFLIEAITSIFAYVNSAINPVLYAFSSKPMRDGFLNCFLVCCGKEPRYGRKELSSRSVTGSTGVSNSVSTISGNKA